MACGRREDVRVTLRSALSESNGQVRVLMLSIITSHEFTKEIRQPPKGRSGSRLADASLRSEIPVVKSWQCRETSFLWPLSKIPGLPLGTMARTPLGNFLRKNPHSVGAGGRLSRVAAFGSSCRRCLPL